MVDLSGKIHFNNFELIDNNGPTKRKIFPTFTRVVGASRRTVATWVAGDPPNRANQMNVSEMRRLFNALAEVVPASQIRGFPPRRTSPAPRAVKTMT